MKKPNLLTICFGLWILSSALISCGDIAPMQEVRVVDSLNNQAYTYRYKELNSSCTDARKAFEQARFYSRGKAEAQNSLAFCAFMQMNFEKSEHLYRSVNKLTSDELERLIADIGLMKIYQRTAMNKEFYDARNRAERRMKRIREDISVFSDPREQLRLNYALSEFYRVSAVYYHYLQQHQEAVEAINRIEINSVMKKDTAQLLSYYYLKGAAGLAEGDSWAERKTREFDYLVHCYRLSQSGKYTYFEGNSLQSISELLMDEEVYQILKERRQQVLQQLNPNQAADSVLSLNLAQKALELFQKYGDDYQIAGVYRTIGTYFNLHKHYREGLAALDKALSYVNRHHECYYHCADTTDRLKPFIPGDTLFAELTWINQADIKTVPEWISRIREQISVSFAGMGNKIASDYNRNIYLDILDYTRQDKELESRYQALEEESRQLNILLSLVLAGILLLILVFWLLNRRSKVRHNKYIGQLRQTLDICRQITASIPTDAENSEEVISAVGTFVQSVEEKNPMKEILQPYIDWTLKNGLYLVSLKEKEKYLEKQLYIHQQHIATNKRQNVSKKACFSIATGITPYLNRAINEVEKIKRLYDSPCPDEILIRNKYEYINELVVKINEYNDILAGWIKMKQGVLSLNIENFALNDLFDVLAKGKKTFEMKQQNFSISPTHSIIKADKALTLFMLNTLTENARKYTPAGGKIEVYAQETEQYVEISVKDNGRGLSPEDTSLILGEKIYDSHRIGLQEGEVNEELIRSKGSGFGLMNCKGIIEQYKKTNSLFLLCLFGIESTPGKGSRFFFRLPKGIRKILSIFLLISFSSVSSLHAQNERPPISEGISYEKLLNEASMFADSAYYANIEGAYDLAIQYADSAINRLNRHYEKYAPQPQGAPLRLKGTGPPAEIQWWNHSFDTDYYIILDVRNEAAVAFLALKDWTSYIYNNEGYTRLYKLTSEDRSLEEYCRKLQHSSSNKMVGIILCILLLIGTLIVYYFLYLRRRITQRMNLEQIIEINRLLFTIDDIYLPEEALLSIPQHIMEKLSDPVRELFSTDGMYMAVYDEEIRKLRLACKPEWNEAAETLARQSFEQESYCSSEEGHLQAFPLTIDVGNDHRCVGVLILLKETDTEQESDRILTELLARYIAIVVYHAVIKRADKYRDIETAEDEVRRAEHENNLLYVQNKILDNCLSTIKHETVYYPNKIQQIVGRSRTNSLEENQDNLDTIAELIAYYKDIFTLLSSCASRQLEETNFRRSVIRSEELTTYASHYLQKQLKRHPLQIDLQTEGESYLLTGDRTELFFLFENLIDEAIAYPANGTLHIKISSDENFVSFRFTDKRRKKSPEELNQLFYPDIAHMTDGKEGNLEGTGYLVCKQIIRDHDEFAGRRGCRINAEQEQRGGFTVYFTLPQKK